MSTSKWEESIPFFSTIPVNIFVEKYEAIFLINWFNYNSDKLHNFWSLDFDGVYCQWI